MAKIQLKDLKSKSSPELLVLLDQTKQQLVALKIQHSFGKLTNPNEISTTKKTIAQIYTVLQLLHPNDKIHVQFHIPRETKNQTVTTKKTKKSSKIENSGLKTAANDQPNVKAVVNHHLHKYPKKTTLKPER